MSTCHMDKTHKRGKASANKLNLQNIPSYVSFSIISCWVGHDPRDAMSNLWTH